MRMAGDRMVAEFDMDALAALGLVKFDFLGLRNLDTLQRCVDLIKTNTGTDIDLYRWRDEYNDAAVWEFISEGNTLGCFQIETPGMTKMTKAVQPKNLHDMADVTTLDRPGPLRSGLDKVYLRRRHGKEVVSFADPRLETVLHRTFGVMLYQEDIMGICRVLAGYDEEHADKVRKILGKKKVELAKAEGELFIPACVERGLTQDAAEAIWKQMEEFSRYSFNKAHAYGYGTLSFWCAWLSYHYPVEFLVAAMSTVDAERIPDFVNGARSRNCKVLPPDINDSGSGFSAVGRTIRFGLDAIKGVGGSAVAALVEHQPYASFEDFMGHKPNMGIAKLVVRAGCFDSLHPNRRQLEGYLAQYESGLTDRCVYWNPETLGAPNNLPCDFDWSSEPPRLGAKGQVIKQKPIPRACTVRCRHYTKRTSLDVVDVEPYTDKEIREIETELFGIYLSSSPFDIIPEDLAKVFVTATTLDEVSTGSVRAFAAIVKAVRQQKDKRDRQYAFVELFLGDGDISAVCFSSRWVACKNQLMPGALVIGTIEKTNRGYTLQEAFAI
jgi:DNA polymerase III subunit alpha